MSSALLDLQYLPNAFWFRNFLKHEQIWIEKEENFVKSTFRNRCQIGGANGKQVLTIPLQGGRDHHQKYKDTKISYKLNWQGNHLHSIRSAYGSAPYFEFYIDKLEKFYEQGFEFLFEYNLALLNTVIPMLKIKKEFNFTSVYEPSPVGIADFRSSKKIAAQASFVRYYQVFEERNGFIPNLSIIDLIFHLGPGTKDYLTTCI